MVYKGFEIYKVRAYVWRLYCWSQFANYAYIDSWIVRDAETGKHLYGGHRSGNNTSSGYALLARRKDAKAFVDGYVAGPDEQAPVYTYRTRGISRAESRPDDGATAMFKEGQAWWEHQENILARRLKAVKGEECNG